MRKWVRFFLKQKSRSNELANTSKWRRSDEDDETRFQRKYSLGETIGKGGFGTVYSATRLGDGGSVAVKVLETDAVTEWDVINKRLVPLEIGLMQRCSASPGVIKLIDWFQMSNGYLIVMERPTPAIDLFDYISMLGQMNESLARYYFRQIVETVLDCLKCGVVHRDIKDENIIIDILNGKIRLIDFGAGALLRNGAYTDYEGTRPCTPPEYLIHGSYHAVPQTVWSLGILLFTMLSGDYPFHSDREIVEGKIPFPRRLSQPCRGLIRRCLCPDPWDRPTLEKLLADPWLVREWSSSTARRKMAQHGRRLYLDGVRSVVDLSKRSLSPLASSLSSTTTGSFERRPIR